MFSHILPLFCSPLLFISMGTSVKISCRDEDNRPVDWFVIYKIPKIIDHEDPLIRNGEAYSYISSNDDRGWINSDRSIDDPKSIPGLTLVPLYKKRSKKLYILYNDEPPNQSTDSSNGHTKGAVLATTSGGIWLVHSVPHFPPKPTRSKHYSYPKTGLRNGQSFLCITLQPDQLEVVGDLLMYNDPHVYAKAVSKKLRKLYPNLSDAADGIQVDSPPWNSSQGIVSADGTEFQAYAKSPEFNKDLYNWVASDLRVSLLVETWPNSRGRLRSSCRRRYRVENIEEVNLVDYFSSTKDHSKWAVSNSKRKPWVCVGDINRAKHQKKRGGGTVCIRDKSLWKAYYDSIESWESCQRYAYFNYYLNEYRTYDNSDHLVQDLDNLGDIANDCQEIRQPFSVGDPVLGVPLNI